MYGGDGGETFDGIIKWIEKINKMRIRLLNLAVAFLSFGMSVLCQTTPFGEIQKIPKDIKLWSTILSYRTNLVIIPYGGQDYSSYSNDNFVKKSEKIPIVNATLSFAGTFKDSPFLVYNYGEIKFLTLQDKWITTIIPGTIVDFDFDDNQIAFITFDGVDHKYAIVKTTDLKFFKRYKLPFLNPPQEGYISKIGGEYIFSNGYQETELLRTSDFTTFEKVEGAAPRIAKAYQFKYVIIYIERGAGGYIFVTDRTFKSSKNTGVRSDLHSFKIFNDVGFTTHKDTKSINYTIDGLNWASFPVNSIYTHREINTLAFFENHLFCVGDENFSYKIGPISSSEPLKVTSELIHSVRITGNIGQQVEVLASDELNGEYKPLKYFTLPSTEFIYNDNRTNKAKQYYKVR